MRKFNIQIVICAICLTLSFLLYCFIVFDFAMETDTKNIYEKMLNNRDATFEKNTISFFAFNSLYGNNLDDEAAFINSLEDKLTDYGYKGFIAPSKTYRIISSFINSNEFTQLFVMEEKYMNNYNFEIDVLDDFNYEPSSLDEVTLYLGNSYKKLLYGNSQITMNIMQKGGTETYEIKAKIAGFFEPNQYDPINQIEMDTAIYIGNIQPLINENITYNNTCRMYTLMFENETNTMLVKPVINNDGYILEYDYFYTPRQAIEDYETRLPFYTMFLIILCILIVFSIALYVNRILRIFMSKDEKEKKNKINIRIITTIVLLILNGLIYLVCSILTGTVRNILLMLIPYIIIISLIGFVIAYDIHFKKGKK